MLYQKSSYVLMVLLSIFLTKNRVYAQDSRPVQIGFYGGAGAVYSTFPDDYLAADFRGGLNVIVPFRKNDKKRFEFQTQYDAHLTSSNYYLTNDKKWHHSLAGTRYDNLNFNFLFHLPILYKEKYKLFIAPGVNTGFTKSGNDGYPEFGAILSFKQEFKLNNRLSLHLDVNSLNQVFVFSLFSGTFAIFHFTGAVNLGLTWRILKKEAPK